MRTERSRAGRKRRPLVPHREQIGSWVRQGASDEWIAQALGTTANSIQSFRSRSGIVRRDRGRPGPTSGPTSVYEGILEHGEAGKEEGYGLWLDPAVADDPVFERGFSGVADVEVSIQPDRIVLRPLQTGRRPGQAGDTVSEEEASRLEGFQPGLLNFEDVQESARSLPASNRELGEVKFFEPDKGYGFIFRPEEAGGGEIFVHRSQISAAKKADSLAAGTSVSYEVGSNQRGLVAEDVREAG